jgi:hypothetical protein
MTPTEFILASACEEKSSIFIETNREAVFQALAMAVRQGERGGGGGGKSLSLAHS